MNERAARDEILRRVRTGVHNPTLAADRGSLVARPPVTRPDPSALVDTWRREFAALGGHAYGPVSPHEALEQAVQILQARSVRQVLAWDDLELPVPGFSSRLAEAGIEVISEPRKTNAALQEIPFGVSGALAALADTGSIMVHSGSGRARAASLIPPVYLAFVRVGDLYPDLPTWMALQGETMLPTTANVVVITGPSRTADIELILVVGVHGPGEIHAVLVDDGAGRGSR